MAIQVVLEGDLLCINCTEIVSRADIEGLIADALRLETELKRSPDRIADLSQVKELTLRYDDIMRMKYARDTAPWHNPFKICAVATTPVQYGLARMFQMVNERSDIPFEIFPTREAALEWLSRK